MLIAEQQRLLFVHNPKAAGTAVKQALAKALKLDRVAAVREFGMGEHLPLLDIAWQLRGYRVDLTGFLILGVLRDPLERLASFWRFGRAPTADGIGSRIAKGLGHLGLSERAMTAMVERVQHYSLERWVRWSIDMTWCPWAELKGGPSVIERPQMSWFSGDRERPLLFRFDRLGDLVAFLAKARGIEIALGRENESGAEQPEFTRWVVEWARETYADDYEAFKDF